ncbi:hypothetical protein [Pseudomonas sp. CGJS7]|uniref:hypothetical protein n=1 Tax=Pseudomonas sp. CGJS7 TaxID=3109348 RepID=UPI0030086125
MRRLILVLILALGFALPALAQSVSFGSKVISVGDPAGRVYDVAGKPNRTIQLENKFGASTGERWEYYLGNKTVLIVVREGKVTEISEVF